MALYSNGQISQQQLNVFIYWDYQNVYLSRDSATLLLEFANLKGHLIDKKVYYNSLSENQATVKNNLQSIGFECYDVPCSIKNSADNQLKSDLIDDLYKDQSPDIFIIVSGDGDFTNPVKCLQDRNNNVIVIAQRGNVKKSLIELADQFHFVDELPQLVQNKIQPEDTAIEYQLSYNEAVDYLTKAIKTAVGLGKRTGLGYINTLMTKLCPKYQGVSSISTDDGKKFKSFGKFIDSAVNSGRIQRQNQELLLIE